VRLLLIEDDHPGAGALAGALRHHGFAVRRATCVQQAVELVGDDIDVALLDVGLSDGDAFELCRRIRSIYDFPIILTAARSDVRSRVHGLQLGADDYLVKPFALAELIARLHAVLRRIRRARRVTAPAEPAADAVERCGVSIDLARRSVRVGERDVQLTRKEFGVLAELARWPGLVVRREQLMSEVWGLLLDGQQHTLDVHIAAVRAKCGVPGLIETVRGVGYRLTG